MKSNAINFLDINSILSGEKNKGLLVSLFSGSIATVVNYILTMLFKVNIHTSTFLSMYVLGNFLTYCFDIIFAKSTFYDEIMKREVKYSFTDMRRRINWLFNSFSKSYMIKFFVSMTIDSIIGLSLMKWIMNMLDDYNILTNTERQKKYRDLLIASLVGILTFFLYLNTLRFSWAYKMSVPNLNLNDIFNLIIIIWFSLCILIVVKFKDTQDLVVDTKFKPVNNDYTKYSRINIIDNLSKTMSG